MILVYYTSGCLDTDRTWGDKEGCSRGGVRFDTSILYIRMSGYCLDTDRDMEGSDKEGCSRAGVRFDSSILYIRMSGY